jgi:hypothetical protein
VAIKEIVDKEAGDDGWYEIEHSGLFRTRRPYQFGGHYRRFRNCSSIHDPCEMYPREGKTQSCHAQNQQMKESS